MVALVAAMLGDRSQAEDIAQEAFSRALTRWQRVARSDLPEADRLVRPVLRGQRSVPG